MSQLLNDMKEEGLRRKMDISVCISLGQKFPTINHADYEGYENPATLAIPNADISLRPIHPILPFM